MSGHYRVNRCDVCGITFTYLYTGTTRTRCKDHRELYHPRGTYRVVTYVDGLDDGQVEWLLLMQDRVMTREMLRDFGADLDGAIVQHRNTGRMYRIARGYLIRLADCVD